MTDIKNYLTNKMRMAHIYQPVMIKTMLINNGSATKTQIAKAILEFDFSQVEYYETITNNMVGRVLRKNGIATKENDIFSLTGFENLGGTQIVELINICEQKIQEYIVKRGEKIWEHRRRNRRPVPGSIRYKVMSRAKHRCELCGISASEKALEVDHILPKNLGGEDSINNYQALCYTCNANKRDTDDTDFRELSALYNTRLSGCVFCDTKSKEVVFENNLAIAFKDKYPVTNGHILIIPKRHCKDYFELTQPEINAITNLSHKVKELIQSEDQSISGFNLGYNVASDAGQTVFHCHMHVIPRRESDVENPIGGIRNVIPGKGRY